MEFEPVIGLEIHVQLATNSKMFCSCANDNNENPNSNICPVCLGLPGALPRINEKAVEFAVMLGIATDCQINKHSVFARKNYFYPDLPKSYQISQFENPICEHGHVNIEVNGKSKRIGITRIHMEEDAGKLLHEGRNFHSSYVDLNRAGVPLLEIVSEPEIKNPEEAKAYMEKIYSLVTYLNICHGDLEKGNLRCDANISLKKKGDVKFGTRTETKNLNSFRFVQQAIEYEINRQMDCLIDGGKIIQETRLFDSAAKKTISMRVKEDSHDYRYFPCPDLPAVDLTEQQISNLQNHLPELPDAKKHRFLEDYALVLSEVSILVGDKAMANYFEAAVKHGGNPKKVVNWLLSDFSRLLNENNIKISDIKVSPQALVGLLTEVDNATISSKMAKDVLKEMFNTGKSAKSIIETKDLSQVSNKDELSTIVKELVAKHTDEAKQYKDGKTKVLGFFVGQIMSQTKGKANPMLVNSLLLEEIDKVI